MSATAWNVLMMVTAAFAASASLGVLLTNMVARGGLAAGNADALRFDLTYTDRTYVLASVLCSIGAMAALKFSVATFGAFVMLALSLQIAEHWLLPRMRAAVDTGADIPHQGTRTRFELLLFLGLAFIFGNLSFPPLITLARVYGL